MELHIKTIGILLILLGLAHAIFPKYFNWKDALQSLNLLNRQVMIVHTFFIGLTIMLMGALCYTSYKEVVETTLGKKISLGLGVLWTCRLFVQLFGYSTKLWRGKTFETTVHLVLTCLWIYLSAIFLMVSLT